MAKLPDSTALGQPGIGPSGRAISSYDVTGYARGAAALAQGTKDIGTGLAQLGSAVGAYAVDEKNKRDELEIAKAESEYQVRTTRFNSQLGDETDDKGLKEKYNPLYSSARDESAAMISDPRKRELWLAKRAPDVEKNLVGVDNRAFTILKDKEIAGVQGKLSELREAALKETDPTKVQEKVTAAHALLDGLEYNGYIDSKTAQSNRQKWAQDYAKAWLQIQPAEDRAKMTAPVASMDHVVDRIIGVEYGSGKVFKNPNSSASGAGQFTNATWLETIKKHRPDIAEGRADSEILTLRADERLSRQMVRAHAQDNAEYLQANGIEANPGTIYLAHFLGKDGAVRTLQADPSKPMSEIVGRDAIRANPSILGGQTAGTVARWAADKMGDPRNRPKLASIVPEDDLKTIHQGALSELNAQRIQREHQAVLEEKQRKQLSAEAENDWFIKIHSNDASVNPLDIARDERMDVSTRDKLNKLIEHRAKSGDKDSNTYGRDFYTLFQRVHASDGDPNRLTDPAELYDYVKEGGGLTLSGMEKLRTEMAGKRTPEGAMAAEMKKQFYINAKKTISGANDAFNIKDSKGEELYLKFMAQSLTEYDAGIKAGKTPMQLLNPDSPDYIGKVMPKRTTAEKLADIVNENAGDPTAAIKVQKPAQFDPRAVNSLDDLKKAHAAGYLNAMEARAIAVQRGWAKERNPAPVMPSDRPTVPLSQ